MSRKKRMQDLREAKDKRMKKIAIGGSVLLVAILAFEVPKMLHSGGSGTSSAPPAATTTGATTTPGSTPTSTPPSTSTATPAGTAAAAVTPTAASTKLTTSDLPPARAKSQLYSFSHFAGKDPFVQQVNPAASAATSSPSQSSGSTSSKQPAHGTQAAAITHKPSRTLAANGAARISVNGRIQVVRVGASFPAANPLFRLVSVAGGVARIGLASGSYTSGARTVSLASGRALTLVDTADGVRYSIRLISAA